MTASTPAHTGASTTAGASMPAGATAGKSTAGKSTAGKSTASTASTAPDASTAPGGSSSAGLAALTARVVERAARSPSAHNTQPWLPRAVDGAAGLIDLSVERGRTLPAGDPTGRDTLLALGCWVEAASVAAAADGAGIEVDLLPGLDDPALIVRAERDEPVARIRIVPGVAAGEATLDAELLDRRLTYRGGVTASPGFLAAAREVVPAWVRLERISARDLTHFAALGTADTVRIPAIARELVHWLRLTPEHPRWDVDGLSAEVLLIPRPLARALAPLSRKRGLRDSVIAVLRRAGDAWRRLLLEVHLDAPGDAVQAEHFVVVVEANELDLGGGVELTRVLNSRLGLPARVVFETGRALMRVWLVAASRGVAFAPQSVVLDSDLAAGELQFRLGLGRREVPLFVASAGVPDASVPGRSPRKHVRV